VRALLRRHATRYALLTCLYLFAVAFLGASFERYWHWLRTAEAVAEEPVRKVDRWTAYCRVKPWSQGCRTVSRARRGEVALIVASGKEASLARDDGGPDYAGVESFTLVATLPGPSSPDFRVR
jgi:hypothetical protein